MQSVQYIAQQFHLQLTNVKQRCKLREKRTRSTGHNITRNLVSVHRIPQIDNVCDLVQKSDPPFTCHFWTGLLELIHYTAEHPLM